ncbi:putative NAD(P)/FAD-binding protein YdhS [Sphingomonas sp. PP-CC-3G-468]|nr:putative NAD(P)/FAD-binding protein YdhS [Sphingomonas sp. PP-CC-3G-468]
MSPFSIERDIMPKTLTIIGMGACGVAAFAEAVTRLSYDPGEGWMIHLIERDDELARGLAFGTEQPGHLLNTESRLMGLYDREPGHFRTWLEARRAASGSPLDPDGVEYPQRREYRVYMQEVLNRALDQARTTGIDVHVHREEAIALEGDHAAATVRLANGSTIGTDVVLLTIGTPDPDRFGDLNGMSGYFDSPYPAHRMTEGIERDQSVVILGSGLSAIDAVMTLLDDGHRGHIHLISKEGMLPRVEIPAPETGYDRQHLTLGNVHRLIRERGSAFSVVDLFRLFRLEAETAAGRAIDWQAEDRYDGDAEAALLHDIAAAEAEDEPFQRILTAARHDSTAIWNLLRPADQKRFGRWLAPHFAAARFVTPMANARRLTDAMTRGLLSVRGRINETVAHESGTGFTVRFENGDTLDTPIVVNATGQATTLDEMKEPLIKDLLAKDWLQPHPVGGAIAHRATCRIISATRDAPRLYALGQLLNGELRDTNAVWFNVECAGRAIDDILRQQ